MLGRRDLGRFTPTEDISELMHFVLALGLLLLLGAIFTVVRNMRERYGSRLEINEYTINATFKGNLHQLNIKEADHLYLFSPPESHQYGYQDTLAFLYNDDWFVLSSYYKSYKPIPDIYQELINNYTNYKKSQADRILKKGASVAFPCLINLENKVSGKNNPQNTLNAKLYQDAFKNKQPISYKHQPESYIFVEDTIISISGKTHYFNDIETVVFLKYKNSIFNKKNIKEWQEGEKIFLFNKNKEVVATIPLPSVYDSPLLKQLIIDRVKNVEYKEE